MRRQHTVEETIVDTLYRGVLVAFLKEKGLIPKDWENCSIQVKQPSAADEIEFISKRSYFAPETKK